MLFNLKLGLFAAAVAAASADEGSLRILHNVRHSNKQRSHANGVNRVESKPRSGGTQALPCLLLEKVKETGHGVVRSWHCTLEGEDVKKAGYEGSQATVAIDGIGFVNDAYDGELSSGDTKILATNAVIDSTDAKLTITASSHITFSHVQTRRKLKSSTGTQKVLVVRVTLSDGKAPQSSASLMSDKVFGTSGDVVNAKSVFEGCSHGKMQVVPATGSGVTNGVMELTSSAGSSGTDDQIYDDVLSKLRAHFSVSDLATSFEFILIAIPDGIMNGAWAYPQTPYSIYGDPNVLYPTMTVHEMGHNLNLDHASEGADTNGDHQGMMGYVIGKNLFCYILCFRIANNLLRRS
mmetsp:Transcript_32111/g.78026  ORF Transcript_32111/g.78026 Transcript_32111/m.78026 type:complete len:350 (+) Transcript_32111:66-1115(+)